MTVNQNKKLFVKHKGDGILIGTLMGLCTLCVFCNVFVDQYSFRWSSSIENFLSFLPINIFVLFGKDMEIIWEQPLYVKIFVLMGKAWLLVWLVLCWGVLSNNRRRTLMVLMGLLLAFSVIPIKLTTQRLRPRNIISNKTPETAMEKFKHSWSFPSGDTAAAFAVAAGVAPFVGMGARFLVFSIAGLIGLSRVAVYAHYASDACAGAMLGIMCAYLGYRLIVSKPEFRRGLLQIFSKSLMIAAIVLIPVIHGASGNWDDIKTFAMFYPAAVGVVYLLSRCKKILTP